MTGWTYILECADASLYVGSTNDLTARMAQHRNGEGAEYTRHRLPVRLIWTAEFDRIIDAFAFEKKVQGWSRAKKLALIESDTKERFQDLSAKGVKPGRHHVSTAHMPTLDV
jgi:putative endonuclease